MNTDGASRRTDGVAMRAGLDPDLDGLTERIIGAGFAVANGTSVWVSMWPTSWSQIGLSSN